jgi:hypothetical protein
MRVLCLALCLACASALAVADTDPNDHSQCRKNWDGSATCPPTNGSLVIAPGWQVVCGRGQCVAIGVGPVWMCAVEPGGHAMINYPGHAVCAGGCERPSAEMCQTLR